MTIFEILLLALSLSFDTFAVSLCSGIALPSLERRRFIFVVAVFAFVQTGFTIGGWILGASIVSYISMFDHWIAFALLCYVGGKMIWESVKCGENGASESADIRSNKILFTVSVATSIDALAVGISIAMISISTFKVCLMFGSIVLITAIAAIVGLKSGRKMRAGMGSRASILGGIILIVIGLKIMAEHFGLF